MIDTQNLPQVAPEISLEELFEAGAHFGHQSKKWHPKMAPWIYAEQDGVHIFDLEKTATQLKNAYNYAYQLGLNKKTFVVVGTKKQASELVETAAAEAEAMYVSHRWLGGLVTNWDQVSKSVKRMNEIEKGLATGKYNDYTKYERTMLSKELERLERFFGGIKDLKKYPDAVFIIDVSREKNALKEVLTEDIPVVALIDSNSNPTGVDIPIPANDDALSSIKLILEYVLAGYKAGKEGKKLSGEATPKAEADKKAADQEETKIKKEVKAEVKAEKEEKKAEKVEVKAEVKKETKTEEIQKAEKKSESKAEVKETKQAEKIEKGVEKAEEKPAAKKAAPAKKTATSAKTTKKTAK